MPGLCTSARQHSKARLVQNLPHSPAATHRLAKAKHVCGPGLLAPACATAVVGGFAAPQGVINALADGWQGGGAVQVSQCAHLLAAAGKSSKGVFLHTPVGIPLLERTCLHWPLAAVLVWSSHLLPSQHSTDRLHPNRFVPTHCKGECRATSGHRAALKKPSSSGRPCGAWRLECCTPGTAKGSKMGQWLATAAAHVFAGAHCRVEGLLLTQACIAAVL